MVLFVLTLAIVGWPVLAVEVRDDRGVLVDVPHPPVRIVSLLPALTETVCALGACHRLVAVDQDSNFPESARTLQRVGNGRFPDPEAIVGQRPDLVLVSPVALVANRLETLGLRVLAFDPQTHRDVHRVLQVLGSVLGVPHAERVWAAMQSAVRDAKNALPEWKRPQRVYLEVDPSGFAAGEASFIGETLTLLGVDNIVPAKLGAFPKLNPEYVLRADPDVLILGYRSLGNLGDRPGWRRMRAVGKNRVCTLTGEDLDVVVRPGPRLGEGAQVLARCLLRHTAGGEGQGSLGSP
ncbi:ABC transporter substrate-binding protein [Candidatus Symbiobacter mobilis]|uniref:ABC transporter substrate-binding protein n=1 Tax=Candidatus Symbiobacter mobilis TaxID=1436290 RepID=UPI00059D85BA|nr:helical backbone metal receptor [Candidatus Symbiobacter mobilis]